MVNSQGEVSRLNTKKEIVMKGNINNYFKLGQEGKYRVYHNQYATNSFALNKHQHREDHDKRRHLSHKFCLSPAGEFKWNGSVHGSKVLTISTLRLTIIQLENNIPSSFLHPNWASHRWQHFCVPSYCKLHYTAHKDSPISKIKAEVLCNVVAILYFYSYHLTLFLNCF